MTRFRASFVHLVISATIVSAVLAIVFLLWYPGPTFRIAGAMSPVFILIGVDLVLGPLLTLIVFKQGKPGLKFDLSFIAVLQLVALLYGSHTLFSARPHFLVFAVDRIALVSNRDIDRSLIRFEELLQEPAADVIRVFARAPADPEVFQRFLNSVLFEGRPDLERRTEYWEPWDAGSETIRSAIKPLATFKAATELEEQRIAAATARYEDDHSNLGILPIGRIEEDIGMLMDRDSLTPLDVIDVNPW
jgi:hypothetical protein